MSSGALFYILRFCRIELCRSWFWHLMLVFLPTVSLAQSDLKQSREEKAAVEEKLEDQKLRLSQVIDREEGLYGELKKFSKNLDRLNDKISGIQKKQKQNQKNIKATETRIADLLAQKKSMKSEMLQLLKRTRRLDDRDLKRFLFQWDRQSDLHRSRRVFERWLAIDQSKVKKYQKVIDQLDAKKKQLESDRGRQAALVKSLKQERQKLAAEKKERKKLLSLVRNQKDFYQKNINELKQAQKRLSQMIQTFSRSKRQGRTAKLKGKILFPVKGRVEKSLALILILRSMPNGITKA